MQYMSSLAAQQGAQFNTKGLASPVAWQAAAKCKMRVPAQSGQASGVVQQSMLQQFEQQCSSGPALAGLAARDRNVAAVHASVWV